LHLRQFGLGGRYRSIVGRLRLAHYAAHQEQQGRKLEHEILL
jgi:hypothetical protein